jgi:hypothetical protein
VIVRVAAWCVAKTHRRHAPSTVGELTSSAVTDSAINPHGRFDNCAHDASAPQSPRRSHDLRVWPMRRAVRRRPALRILQRVLRCLGTGRIVSRLRPPRTRRRSARRGGVHQNVIHSVARIGVDMPLCSRRAWTTFQGPMDPSRLTTYPPRWLRRRRRPSTFFNQIPNRKTADDYHHDHPDTAADAALRGLLLSRLNRTYWPSLIPALTIGIQQWPSAAP